MIVQRLINGVFELLRGGGQRDELLGTPVNLASLEIHDATSQRTVRHVLICGPQGGIDVQAARVGFFPVLCKHQLADRFSHVFRMNFGVVRRCFYFEIFFFGGCCLVGGDEAVFQHALDDVKLARFGPLGVADRVVGRRRLG